MCVTWLILPYMWHDSFICHDICDIWFSSLIDGTWPRHTYCMTRSYVWHVFLDGFCSTVQRLLDWFEVDLGFTELLFIQIRLCVLCDFVLYSRVSLSSCPFLDILHCLSRAVGVPLESALSDVTQTYVLYDSFIRVTWLIYMTWLIHSCDMTHSYLQRADSYVCRDSFMCVTWLILVCDMTHSCVRHDSFTCATWLIHVCLIHSYFYVWHGSFMCVTLAFWFINVKTYIQSEFSCHTSWPVTCVT